MRALVATLSLLFAIAFARATAADPRAYVVIVNPANGAVALDRKFVEEAFLKKISHWPNDEALRPVDLAPSSPVRRRFSEEVLSRSVEAVKGYWQQRIFAGRDVPPPELEDDAEVVKYVLKHPGGVGYVSATTHLGGARAVAVQ
jgi:ABC-type phosphate transport system substrate-binding protein